MSQRNVNSYGNNQNQSEYIDLNIHKNAFWLKYNSFNN
jgi:hypothetical protein